MNEYRRETEGEFVLEREKNHLEEFLVRSSAVVCSLALYGATWQILFSTLIIKQGGMVFPLGSSTEEAAM